MTDLIDTLAALPAGHGLTQARDQRPQAKASAQASYEALFSPRSDAELPLETRHLVALYVAALTGEAASLAHYRNLAEGLDLAPAAEALAAGQTGPWGAFPDGPLSNENTTGAPFPNAPEFEPKLRAALAYAHLLTLHPRDAAPGDLQKLLDAGWSTEGIVTLSQLIAFLAFQIRIVHGLKTAAGQ